MANTMAPDSVAEFVDLTMAAGQIVLIEILNADGSVAETLSNDVVPAGFSFEGCFAYSGKLSPAA